MRCPCLVRWVFSVPEPITVSITFVYCVETAKDTAIVVTMECGLETKLPVARCTISGDPE